MKSKEAFESFYENELKRRIEDLESQRIAIANKYSFKRYKRNIKWLVIATVGAGIAMALFPQVPAAIGLIAPVTIGYAIIGAIYILVMRNKLFKPLYTDYKQTIIPKIISFVDSNLVHKPNEGITRDEFNRGNLFGSYSSYRSEDLVFGKVGDLEISMSDIECTRRKGSSNGSGTSSSTTTIFKGLYIISKLSGKMSSGVIIRPAIPIRDAMAGLARQFLGDQFVNAISEKFNLNDIQIGDKEFDNKYTIKSVTPEVAKSLITPRMIQLILTFQKEIDLPIHFSFFDNQVHIAFSGVNLFEADVHTSFVEKNISKQYFNYLNLAFGITEGIQASR